jgi:DNA-binding IclR family transcriptional regulator
MSPVQQAILNAISAGPKTINDLMDATGYSDQYVRTNVATLVEDGLIRRGGRAERVRRMGAPTYRWELVA